MPEKKVSVVLPVYNGADYISYSINSIIAQTYQNWELIIVNDCSTDDTLAICNEFAKEDNRIKIYSNEINMKLPNSLNVGFDVATGDYYTWTSDDNMYKPNAFEVMINVFQNNPDAVMVYADFTDIDSNGNIIGQYKLKEPQHIVSENVCGACFLYTAEVAKEVGKYDANLFLAEDYDYWIRINEQGRIIHITDDLYLYRRHAKSLSETKSAFVNEQTYKTLEKNFIPLYTLAKENGLKCAFINHILNRAGNHLGEIKQVLLEADGNNRLIFFEFIAKKQIRQIKKQVKKCCVYIFKSKGE